MHLHALKYFEFTFAPHGSYRLDEWLARAVWHRASMPGDSIRHLREAGIETADPLQSDHMRAYLPYEKCDFIYRTRVTTRAGRYYSLSCHGLDTFCDVYWNGKLIHHSESSFIRFRLDVSGETSSRTEHELVFVFLSPTELVAKRHPDFEPGKYAVVFDEPLRILMRKPQFHYGWDNAPHLAGVGFISMPYLEETEQPLFLRDLHLNYDYDWQAREAAFTVRLGGKAHRKLSIRASLSYEGKQVWRSELFTLSPGVLQNLQIAAGKLTEVNAWQVRGYGKAGLYELVVETETGERLAERKIGFRHVELSTKVEWRTVDFRIGSLDPEAAPMDGSATRVSTQALTFRAIDDLSAGSWSRIKTEPYETEVREFRLIINGVRIFAMGYNWQPLEVSLANITDERWSEALALFGASGANTLRVWGGGYIEDQRLYDFCDREGILVWQDFQFACALYPDQDPGFRKWIEAEVRDIHLRLHLHPSVGIFCGSNEIDMMLEDRHLDIQGGNTIGYRLIPETLRQAGSTVPYHVSSPSGRDYPRSPFSGDGRNWTARLHVENDYPLLRCDIPRVNSEGGASALPSRSLAASFLPPGELHEDILRENDIYQIHAGSTIGYDRGRDYFTDMYRNARKYFGDWHSLDELIYLTQLFQSDALMRYVENFRYKENDCGGCLIWKFSDLWPCLELSVLDYANRPKMAFYSVRRAFADTIVCPFLTGDQFTFSVNAHEPMADANLKVEYLGLDGRVLSDQNVNLAVARGINHTALQFSREQLRREHGLGKGLFRSRLSVAGKVVAERIFIPEVMRRMEIARDVRPEFDFAEAGKSGGHYRYELSLRAPETLLGVNIGLVHDADGRFLLSDNAFHMVRGEQRQLTIESTGPLEKGDLLIQTLNSIEQNVGAPA
jgi:beta-mannosidase